LKELNKSEIGQEILESGWLSPKQQQGVEGTASQRRRKLWQSATLRGGFLWQLSRANASACWEGWRCWVLALLADAGRRKWAQVQEQRWRRDRQAMVLSERQGRNILRRGFAKLD
jgi:hypothetical protein